MRPRPATYLRALAAVCALLGVVPLANMLSAGAVPWWPAAVSDWAVRGGMLLVACACAAWLLGDRVDTMAARATGALERVPPRAFATGIAILAAVAAAAVALWSFAGLPFTSDEMASQFHARILLSGRLSAVHESYPEFFNTAAVFDRDGRWFSQYPVGGPALLALGIALNASWLVNPLLLGAAAAALYALLRAEGHEARARWIALLFVASPMVLIMAGSQLNHVPVLLLAIVALAATVRWASPGLANRWAAVIGLSLAMMAAIRPLDAVIVAAVIGSYQLWMAARRPDLRRSLAVQVAAGSIPLVLVLWANHRTTGDAMLFGYEALNGVAHKIGFHTDPYGDAHTPVRGMQFVSGYLMRLSRYLFEWPLPAMLFVVAGLAVAAPTPTALLLAATAAGFLVAYGAYWFDGFFAGPRYLFTALPAFVYFAAQVPAAAASVAAGRTRPLVRRTVILLVPACVAISWLTPWGESSALQRVASYREQRTKLKTDVGEQVERAGLQNALVFVNEGWRGRLLARLRVLGLTQFRAERVLNTTDACALQTELDRQPRVRNPDRAERLVQSARAVGTARLEAGLPADRAVALVPGTRPTPVCLDEFLRDSTGTMPYAMFLAGQEIGPEGRVGGRVVFARDLGAQNELLRERFGDRTWYRYQPGRALGDTLTAFIPYAP